MVTKPIQTLSIFKIQKTRCGQMFQWNKINHIKINSISSKKNLTLEKLILAIWV